MIYITLKTEQELDENLDPIEKGNITINASYGIDYEAVIGIVSFDNKDDAMTAVDEICSEANLYQALKDNFSYNDFENIVDYHISQDNGSYTMPCGKTRHMYIQEGDIMAYIVDDKTLCICPYRHEDNIKFINNRVELAPKVITKIEKPDELYMSIMSSDGTYTVELVYNLMSDCCGEEELSVYVYDVAYIMRASDDILFVGIGADVWASRWDMASTIGYVVSQYNSPIKTKSLSGDDMWNVDGDTSYYDYFMDCHQDEELACPLKLN